MSLETKHLDRLNSGGHLVLANHPSLIDVVILIALVNNPDGVIKAPLLYNPFTLGLLRFAGFIRNEEGPELVIQSINSIKNGNNLIIFPEGTRTKDLQELRFKRGASTIAIRGKINISPILIVTSEPVLRKGAKWYKVPYRKPVFSIVICETIDINNIVNFDGDLSIESRSLTRYLEDYFLLKLKNHAKT
jgi:1-acyl-sn-glycerol-3-phosphate acyltransferase